MDKTNLLSTLNSIAFSHRYWDLCDRFPFEASSGTGSGKKSDVMAAFADAGAAAHYDSRDRSYRVEEEQIGNLTWSGLFVKQRGIAELMLLGSASSRVELGSNFAVLAYDAMRFAHPSFVRDRFSGTAPYPRPAHNGDPVLLVNLVKEFVALVRITKDAIRQRSVAC